MRPADILVASMLGSALLICGSASADPTHASRTVSYKDLDLSRKADVKTLYNRLTLAAKEVCWPESYSVGLRQRRIGERCMAHAMSGAIDRIGSVDLSARFQYEYRYYVAKRELQVVQSLGGEKKTAVAVGRAHSAASLGSDPLN